MASGSAQAPSEPSSQRPPSLHVSANGRFFATQGGAPLFWLGDTAWLLFKKLTREDAEEYLEDRRRKGFNLVQAMLLHDVSDSNAYGDRALRDQDVGKPRVTPGGDAADAEQYDYWDHVDYVVDLAAKKGIVMALVPVWGSNVTRGRVSAPQVAAYGRWLARRYAQRANIVWLNGGDVDAAPGMPVWQALGETLHRYDPSHLTTFHPRGRLQSSDWFHAEPWLAFNMFQSGHRTYAQDDTPRGYGEDSWRYVESDYARRPVKPTIDGEPSYEGIPHGLHDLTQPRWTDADVRRYAYWSVFAGAAGFTYGHNSVMQFHKAGAPDGAFGATQPWRRALDAPGAGQLVHLKQLLLSRPYFERTPDDSILAANRGERYQRLVATRGRDYAMVYAYAGQGIRLRAGVFGSRRVRALWVDPKTGEQTVAGVHPADSELFFDSPGPARAGNDWVLLLDAVARADAGHVGGLAPSP